MSKESFISNDDGFQKFCHISLEALNKHAPLKNKYIPGNRIPVFDKEL